MGIVTGGSKPSSNYTGAETGANLNSSNAKTVTVKAKWCQTIHNFSYKNSAQTFTADCDGYYKIELWGAQGGIRDTTTQYSGDTAAVQYSYAGYTSGSISIQKNTTFFIHTGEKGIYVPNGITSSVQTYNGGGYITQNGGINIVSAGGATDIRTENGVWSNAEGLRSRIMVAGGSGSVSSQNKTLSAIGHGGGLTGYTGVSDGRSNAGKSSGGTQTTGGSYTRCNSTTNSGYSGSAGSFGYGGNAVGCASYGAPGGSGWYGGGGTDDVASGSGGSSYISGMSGSIGVTSTGTAKCSAGSVSVSCSESWTGYKIVAGTALMIDGAGHKWPEGSSVAESGYTQMPNPSGGYYASGVGHSGNGYARITYLGTSI